MYIDLKELNYTQGFRILGASAGDQSGIRVNKVGDTNDDGIAGVIISAKYASPLNRTNAGESYVIYGIKDKYFNDIDLSNLSRSQGFKISGGKPNDRASAINEAGDVNSDGIDDIIVGAWNASVAGRVNSGESM